MKRKFAAAVVVLLALVAIAWLARPLADWDWLVAEEAVLRRWRADQPWQAAFVGYLVYAATSLIPGTVGKSLLWGWLYDWLPALAIVNAGMTSAAVIEFHLSRFLFREAAERRFGLVLRHLDRISERDGPVYLVLLRVIHAPFTATNYALGATHVRGRTFWWTTQLGLLPGNFLFVYAGSRLPTLSEVARVGWSALFTPEACLAFAFLSIVPLLLSLAARRWRG